MKSSKLENRITLGISISNTVCESFDYKQRTTKQININNAKFCKMWIAPPTRNLYHHPPPAAVNLTIFMLTVYSMTQNQYTICKKSQKLHTKCTFVWLVPFGHQMHILQCTLIYQQRYIFLSMRCSISAAQRYSTHQIIKKV